jgi:hypothetical protein
MSAMQVQQRTALAAATLVLFGAVAGLILDAREDPASAALASPTPIATSSASPEPRPVPGVSTPPAVARTTAPVPTIAVSATPASGSVTPPKAGTYTYKVNSNGESADEQMEIASRGGGRQSEEQDGVRADVAWTSTEKIVDRILFGPLNCDWVPNLQELKFPLVAGKSWTVSGSCSTPEGLKMSFKGSSRVSGMQQRTVAGSSIQTWRLLNDFTIRASGGGESFEQHVTQDAYLSPAHGLYVYSADTSEGTDPATGEEGTTNSTSELRSLTPA